MSVGGEYTTSGLLRSSSPAQGKPQKLAVDRARGTELAPEEDEVAERERPEIGVRQLRTRRPLAPSPEREVRSERACLGLETFGHRRLLARGLEREHGRRKLDAQPQHARAAALGEEAEPRDPRPAGRTRRGRRPEPARETVDLGAGRAPQEAQGEVEALAPHEAEAGNARAQALAEAGDRVLQRRFGGEGDEGAEGL